MTVTTVTPEMDARKTPGPMTYPSELKDRIVLPDRRLLYIRPLRRFEDGVVRELYDRLSPKTRYQRFFSAMPALPDSVLRRLTCVDYTRQLALIGKLVTADGAEIVALGSFAAIDDTSAEVGLVVRDDWQQHGIGVALAASVMRAAEARGFDRFVAHVLWDNTAIRRLVRHVGSIVSSTTRQGVSELTFAKR
jgi:RimJ/RimL family protein N-acetyltransferase